MTDAGLEVVEVYKNFGATRALAGVSLDVAQGEVIALLGPSGCGKSTLLTLIAGLEPPDQGEILWEGSSLASVPPHRRGFGMMFQDFALFPHRNVFDNVAFGLQMARWTKEQVQERVSEVLTLVGLASFEKRDVNTLSGGEQQRVALARSLAPRPRLLMLDEPLGSLDRGLRERLALELGEILRSSRQTAIYVTHDQEEAFVLADRVVVMRAGRIEQVGTPQEIYRQPASPFVAHFLGLDNLLSGEVRRSGEELWAETPAGRLPLTVGAPGPAMVLLRPDAFHLDGQGSARIRGRIRTTSFRGDVCQAVVDVNGQALEFHFPSNVKLPAAGEIIELSYNPAEAIRVFSS